MKLEDVGAIDWPFKFWDVEKSCRVNRKFEALKRKDNPKVLSPLSFVVLSRLVGVFKSGFWYVRVLLVLFSKPCIPFFYFLFFTNCVVVVCVDVILDCNPTTYMLSLFHGIGFYLSSSSSRS